MKTKKIIRILFLVLVTTAVLFSCAHAGTFAQIGAAIGQATGVLSPQVADAIARSGVAWGQAFEEITPEQEYFIGRAVAAHILTTYRIQTNRPAMLDYVNRICMALVINSPRPEIFNGYRVNILDTDEINAFATPGGHIFLSRGLIESAASEDALAAVIAHEIAHIQLQHGLKAIRNSRITQALLVTGTSAASVATDMDIAELTSIFSESINEIVTTLVTNGFSREQEFEADATAMALMSLAGYDPPALIEMLRVLEVNQPRRAGGFNRTHPTPALRITNAQRTVGNYNVPDTRSFREARFSAVR